MVLHTWHVRLLGKRILLLVMMMRLGKGGTCRHDDYTPRAMLLRGRIMLLGLMSLLCRMPLLGRMIVPLGSVLLSGWI